MRLDLTREHIQAAMSILRENRPAQVALLAILGGTRFRYFHKGVLIPTYCPRMKRGHECGEKDSFDHLIRCYALQTRVRTGAESIPFLVVMAKKAIPLRPRTARPFYPV